MQIEKEGQLALREKLFRLVSNIIQLTEALGTLSQRLEDLYLDSNLPEADQVKMLARNLISRAQE